MLDRFKRFLQGPAVPEEGREDRLRLAAAALLVEVMRADHRFAAAERETITRLLRLRFGLDARRAQELLALADTEAEEATSYYAFTRLINEGFTPEEKAQLIEMMWRVAYADGEVEKYEEHVIRKVAQLLHVPHTAFVAARHRAAPRD